MKGKNDWIMRVLRIAINEESKKGDTEKKLVPVRKRDSRSTESKLVLEEELDTEDR